MLSALLRAWRDMRQRTPTKDERGTALLMVLLLVAVMSATATALLDDIRFAVRRSSNINDREQALWYALGAERMARGVVYRSYQDSPTRSTMIEPWAVSELLLPIDGGRIEGAVRDGGNCFNLNALVTGGPGAYIAPEDSKAAALFVRLLTLLEVPQNEAEILADSIIDWMDTDSAPHGKGAEDYDYVARTPPRRTANTRFADVQELRAVRGVTPELYEALAPFVCALPTDEALRLNVNTLQEADAPLIVVALDERINLVDALSLITDRPIDGFTPDISGFWELDMLEEEVRADDTEIRSRFEQNTLYYDLTARIYHHGAFVQVSSTLEQDPTSGELSLVRRRYGALE